MAYEVFKERVIALVRKSNEGVPAEECTKVQFRKANGRFYANCSDGTTIVGNSESVRIAVRFGSGHQAMATLG